MFKVPEEYRITGGPLGSAKEIGNNGAFIIPGTKTRPDMRVVCSDQLGWEHVSVSLNIRYVMRCPTWEEMCFIKSLFWDEEDCVIQYHPAESDYVNVHEFCLHLWRPTDQEIPKPPTNMIG